MCIRDRSWTRAPTWVQYKPGWKPVGTADLRRDSRSRLSNRGRPDGAFSKVVILSEARTSRSESRRSRRTPKDLQYLRSVRELLPARPFVLSTADVEARRSPHWAVPFKLILCGGLATPPIEYPTCTVAVRGPNVPATGLKVQVTEQLASLSSVVAHLLSEGSGKSTELAPAGGEMARLVSCPPMKFTIVNVAVL